MLVLWNDEYEEREINDFSEKHLKYMDEQHQKWVSHVVGDFTVLKVEYDWGRRDQRWTIKCNLCGRELYQYHVADWCAIYGKPQYQVEKMLNRGCTIEVALQTAETYAFQQFTVKGVTGNLSQICKYFDVLAPTVKYRMEHMGMTLEDAIFTPTKRAAT